MAFNKNKHGRELKVNINRTQKNSVVYFQKSEITRKITKISGQEVLRLFTGFFLVMTSVNR